MNQNPFTVPVQNYWQGNRFVIPGYIPGLGLRAILPRPFVPPPVLPPVPSGMPGPSLLAPRGNAVGFAAPALPTGLLNSTLVTR
jgi:hypothetical protein